MPEKVAVTYSWNRMAYIINRSLSLKGIKVFTGDTSFLNMNRFSLMGNKNFRYPSFYNSTSIFLDYLIKYLHDNDIPYLIPTHEEVFIISKYKHLLNNIKTLVPDFESLKIAHKKSLSSALANKLGIPVPLTYLPESEMDCFSFFNSHPKPIVIKYENSNSSKGVFFIYNLSELEKHLSFIGDFIMQEYVTGTGYGVSVLYNKGQLRSFFTHKRLEEKMITGGPSTSRTGTRNEVLEEWTKKILDSLSWNGVAMAEYKFDEINKKYWFIEINPRFWGSLALPYYSGMDFPYQYYRILRDGDINELFSYKEGVKVKWLLGGVLGFLDTLTSTRKIRFKHLSLKADYFDDFSLKDPFVFAGEVGYYSEKFLHSFRLNPTKNSLLNIDEI